MYAYSLANTITFSTPLVQQNNQKLSEEQKQYLTNLLSEMGGDVL